VGSRFAIADALVGRRHLLSLTLSLLLLRVAGLRPPRGASEAPGSPERSGKERLDRLSGALGVIRPGS
jgi:hypothetical protein